MKNVNRLLSLLLLFFCSSLVIGQNSAFKQKDYSADFIIAVGTSSILGDGNRAYTQLQSNGSYDVKGAHFYEFGVNFKKKLKRNSLSIGLHVGSWRYKIEGYEYIMPQSFFESVRLSEDKFESNVNFQRLSIPVTYIIQPKNTTGINVTHEFGMIADLMLHNTYGAVTEAANSSLVPNNRFDDILICGVGYGNVRNVGMRLFYGISTQITPRISFDSKIKIGGFSTEVFGASRSVYDLDFRGDFFYGYFHEALNYRIFEMGMGLKYAIF